MALLKEINYENSGFSCTYWKIGRKEDRFHDGYMTITMFGWKDQPTRLSNAQPLDRKEIIISVPAYEADMTREDIYVYTKQQMVADENGNFQPGLFFESVDA